jgi:hypothetical protein
MRRNVRAYVNGRRVRHWLPQPPVTNTSNSRDLHQPPSTPPPNMAIGDGRTEVPDSEDEPMTSSPVPVSERNIDKLPANAPVPHQERQDALHETNCSHQAYAKDIGNAALPAAESLPVHRNNHSDAVHVPTNIAKLQAAVSTGVSNAENMSAQSASGSDTIAALQKRQHLDEPDFGTRDAETLRDGLRETAFDCAGSQNSPRPTHDADIQSRTEQEYEESGQIRVDGSAQVQGGETDIHTVIGHAVCAELISPRSNRSRVLQVISILPAPDDRQSHRASPQDEPVSLDEVHRVAESEVEPASIDHGVDVPPTEQDACSNMLQHTAHLSPLSPTTKQLPDSIVQHGDHIAEGSAHHTVKPSAASTVQNNGCNMTTGIEGPEQLSAKVARVQGSHSASSQVMSAMEQPQDHLKQISTRDGSSQKPVEMEQQACDGRVQPTTLETSQEEDGPSSASAELHLQTALITSENTPPASMHATAPKTPQGEMLAELKAQKAALLASLAALPAIQVLIEENEPSDVETDEAGNGPIESEVMAAANKIVKDHIKLLHEYNELKDVGQGLMGLIADQRGVRIVEVQDEFGIDAKD